MSMRILIDVDLDNDAFRFPNDQNYELWVYLSYWVDRIVHEGAQDHRIKDKNGNSCGRVTVFDTDDQFDRELGQALENSRL